MLWSRLQSPPPPTHTENTQCKKYFITMKPSETGCGTHTCQTLHHLVTLHIPVNLTPCTILQLTHSSPTAHPQFTYSSSTAHLQLTRSSATAHLQLTHSSATVHLQLTHSSPTTHLQLTYSSPTAHPQLTYSSPTAHLQLAYSSPTAHLRLTYSSPTAQYIYFMNSRTQGRNLRGILTIAQRLLIQQYICMII